MMMLSNIEDTNFLINNQENLDLKEIDIKNEFKQLFLSLLIISESSNVYLKKKTKALNWLLDS